MVGTSADGELEDEMDIVGDALSGAPQRGQSSAESMV